MYYTAFFTTVQDIAYRVACNDDNGSDVLCWMLIFYVLDSEKYQKKIESINVHVKTKAHAFLVLCEAEHFSAAENQNHRTFSSLLLSLSHRRIRKKAAC